MSASNANSIDRIAAMRFVEALNEESAEVWLDAVRAAQVASVERAHALDVLGSLAREHRLGLELWYLTDAIETSAWYTLPEYLRAPGIKGHSESRDSVIEVARIASSALLMRRCLTPAQFDALYSPFSGRPGNRALWLVR